MNRKQTIHNHIRLPKSEFAHSVFKCTPLKFYIDFKYCIRTSYTKCGSFTRIKMLYV